MLLGPPWFDPPQAWSLDGHTIFVCEPSTIELVRALLVPDEPYEGSGFAVVLACCERAQDRQFLAERIFTPGSPITLQLLAFVADELVGMYCGVPRWTAQRLWQRTLGAWSVIDGELQLRGVDVVTLPPARATAAVLAMWRHLYRHNERELDRLERELDKPPLRVIQRDTADDTDTAFNAVEGLLAQSGGRPRSGNTIIDGASDTLERK